MKFLLFLISLVYLCGHTNNGMFPVRPAPLPTLARVASFPVGFAIGSNRIRNNGPYRQAVVREASSITAEVAMKPSLISPQKGVYQFEQADELITFARVQKKRVHGHTLVWYIDSSPDWLKQIRDSTELEATLQSYIRTVAMHFRGKVASWDVVNESFDKHGIIRTDSLEGPGRTTFNVGKTLGKDYVARMFSYAHQADPDARLFYNDYEQETRPAKLDAILAMVADVNRRGIPIHGLQMHININIPDAGIENAIRLYAKTGLLVHISELDIAINPGKAKDFVPTPELLEKQYEKYKFVVSAYKKLVPARQQFGITMWGIDDGTSWIPGFCKCADNVLLFDADYGKKRAYQGFLDGLT